MRRNAPRAIICTNELTVETSTAVSGTDAGLASGPHSNSLKVASINIYRTVSSEVTSLIRRMAKHRGDEKYTRNYNRKTYTRYSLLGVLGDDRGIILKRILQIYNVRMKKGFNWLRYSHASDIFTANSSRKIAFYNAICDCQLLKKDSAM